MEVLPETELTKNILSGAASRLNYKKSKAALYRKVHWGVTKTYFLLNMFILAAPSRARYQNKKIHSFFFSGSHEKKTNFLFEPEKQIQAWPRPGLGEVPNPVWHRQSVWPGPGPARLARFWDPENQKKTNHQIQIRSAQHGKIQISRKTYPYPFWLYAWQFVAQHVQKLLMIPQFFLVGQ